MQIAELIQLVRGGADFSADETLRVRALAALMRTEGLLRELEDTESWLKGRAGALRRASLMKDNRTVVRVEATRFEGRAALIRQALIKFKE